MTINRIIHSPDVLHGAPRIVGTRISVSAVLDLLRGGKTPEEIISADYYPDLTLEDVAACVAWGRGE